MKERYEAPMIRNASQVCFEKVYAAPGNGQHNGNPNGNNGGGNNGNHNGWGGGGFDPIS